MIIKQTETKNASTKQYQKTQNAPSVQNFTKKANKRKQVILLVSNITSYCLLLAFVFCS